MIFLNFATESAQEFGIRFSSTMGNRGNWKNNLVYENTTTAQLHSVVSSSLGQNGGRQWQADPTYETVFFVLD